MIQEKHESLAETARTTRMTYQKLRKELMRRAGLA
jgi:predicted HTH domain antitoxin